jgi:hypothetical protein
VQALDQTRTIVELKNKTVTVYNRRPKQRIIVANFDPDVRERKMYCKYLLENKKIQIKVTIETGHLIFGIAYSLTSKTKLKGQQLGTVLQHLKYII